MSDEIQKAVIFRQPVPIAPGDTMSDLDLTLPKTPTEPDPFEGVEEGANTAKGFVLISVYFPSMHALDIGELIINAYRFDTKKEAEARKRKILKRNQDKPPAGMQIVRIRPLINGDSPWYED